MDTEVGKQGSVSKTKVPRLYHTKSRNGCQRCRARRVKCDEKRPACSSCTRHAVPCTYQNAELIAARQNYFGLSLREHRKAVAQLCSKSADSVCFASTLVLIDAFASIQDRVLEPYTPPMAWINMARGAGSIFKASLDSIKHYETSKIMKVVNAHPRLGDNDVLFAESNRKNLLGLLTQDIASGQEIWDRETREAYEKTLSYIGGALGFKNHEHQLANCRRMMAFANVVPEKFLTFVEERRPRSLAVLAHFFALSAGLDNLWWIRDTGRREIGAIQRFLPDEWQDLIRFPVGVVGLKPV